MAIPDELATPLRRLAHELGVPLSSVLLAAHAKVLAALSGERDVTTGYVPVNGGRPLPCRLTTEPRLVAGAGARHPSSRVGAAVAQVLPGRRSPARAGPDRTAVRDRVRSGRRRRRPRRGHGPASGPLAIPTAGSWRGCATGPKRSTRTAPPGSPATISPRSHGSPPIRMPSTGGRACSPPRRCVTSSKASPARAGSCRTRRFHELFEQRVEAHPDAVAAVQGDRQWTLPGAERPCQPAGTSPAGAGAAPRRRRRGGDRAQPGLDGRRPRGLQGRRRVPAHRAAFPGRAHRDHAVPCRVRAGADRTRQHRHARPGPRRRWPGSRRSSSTPPTRRATPAATSASAVAPDQLAYIYFTSGSTGEPKGAMCEHAGMLNHLYAKIDDLEIGEGQVVAQTAPQCFDISLWQLVSALLVGGRTLLVEQEVILDVERFVDTIVRRPGRRAPGRAVVPRGRAVLPGAAPPRAARPALRVGHRRGADEGARPSAGSPPSPRSSWSTRTG